MIVVAVTGASGAIYANRLLNKLAENETINNSQNEVSVVFSATAIKVWQHELPNISYTNFPFKYYEADNFFVPFASGSAKFSAMIICPCSMGMLAKVATGIAEDLISRAADVFLKERRKLILVCRETPLNLIHIENMRRVTLAGGIICPAVPSFYNNPQNITELIDTVVDRIFDLAQIPVITKRWLQ